MPQVFHPSSNSISRLSIVCGLTAPIALILITSGITRSGFNTDVDVPKDQPIPFSHEHHATELGIDCRYCHTSVETSATAGVPPTQTCMSCHSQIWTNSPLLQPLRESYRTGTPLEWTKLNSVPDFVYFNHSIHINRGISCNYCHGPVQTMMLTYKAKPLFMAWCLNCHRQPEQYIGPRKGVFDLYWDYQRGVQTLTQKQLELATTGEFQPTPQDIQEGDKLLVDYRMTDTKKQLTDCWTCHR